MHSFAAHVSLMSFMALMLCFFGMNCAHLAWTAARVYMIIGLVVTTVIPGIWCVIADR